MQEEKQEILKEVNLDTEVVSSETSGGENLNKISWKLVIGGCLIVVLGVVTGWGLKKWRVRKNVSIGSESYTDGGIGNAVGSEIKKGQVFGQEDGIFSDQAIGVIKKNDDGKEGTHKLIREGGDSQTAYLTSSVVDLNMFLGRKVEIKGETFAAQSVGWLLDVGYVKVLE